MAGGSKYEPNDYFCEDCCFKFEEFQLIAERDFAECPKCGKQSARIIGVHFSSMECFDGTKAKVDRDIKEMNKKIRSGDEKFISNFRGPEAWEK